MIKIQWKTKKVSLDGRMTREECVRGLNEMWGEGGGRRGGGVITTSGLISK